ncbi:GntR family transcriptional regulator [Saccharopolyspora sp. MS10]|uniref:GntR family transcriptional regulator n=1 Tax=Saccharopolyspora sp. MS10 TaxID=3385973 RepID=UPI0039A162F8
MPAEPNPRPPAPPRADLRWHGAERPPTTQEFVLAALRRAITTGELPPGRPIRQDAVAAELGVSRVPLREALKTLAAEGQVVYRAHRGYAVAELSLDDLLEVYRLRALLESEAAAVAAGRFTPAQLELIAAAARDVERASGAGDLVEMITANRRFHFALLEPCGMPRLLRIVRTLWDATDAYRAVYYNSEDNRERVRAEHEQIVRAAAEGAADRLVALLDAHREHAVAALRATIPAGRPTA